MADINRISSEDRPPYRARPRRATPTSVAKPNATEPETWPAFWRVVAPGAGAYDHDMVMLQTNDEQLARTTFKSFRQSKYAVRLEFVHCGPLPKGYMDELRTLRSRNPQNPGTTMQPILGAWTES